MKQRCVFSHKCSHCCKKFPSKFTLLLHLQRKHIKRGTLKINCKKEEPFDDFALSENDLSLDIKIEEIKHSELNIKTECYEDNIIKSYLDVLKSSMCKKDMEKINLKEIDYFDTRTTCKLCNKITSKKNLKRHIFLCHSTSISEQDENKFPCTICAKEFKNKSLLARHHKNVHLQKSKLTCKICKKQFCTHDTLKRHNQMVHSNDSKVTCTICNKQLKHKFCLKEHMKNLHADNPKIICKICNKQFWKKSLKRHLSRKHMAESDSSIAEKHIKPLTLKESKQINHKKKLTSHMNSIKKEENSERHE